MKSVWKKTTAGILIGCMLLGMTGCGAVDAAANAIMGGNTSETNGSEITDEVTDEVTDESNEDTTTVAPSDCPVLGDEDIEDYDGFQYLYCEELRTESEKNQESGKMESSRMQVFIPEDEYNYMDRDRVSGSKFGLSFDIQLNPYLRYDEEDYLLTENLDYLLEDEFDPFYSDDYKDIVVTDAEEYGDNGAIATVEYCDYNEYDDSYSTVFKTFYLKEFDNNVKVLAEFAVNAEEVTGKLPGLISELESFYQITIDWDEQRAADKMDSYMSSGDDSQFSTGYMIFTLPQGWKKDTSVSSYDSMVYAPDGDMESAECYISLSEEYVGFEVTDAFDVKNNQEAVCAAVKSMAEESMTELGDDWDVSYYGDTCLGQAILLTANITYEDGEAAECEMYWAIGDGYIYIITAAQTAGSSEDALTIIKDVLENGQIRE